MSATVIVIHPEGIRVPGDLGDLARFRAWTQSSGFPERGRIDWIAGEVDVDMSPENLTTHGSPKMAIAARLHTMVVEERDTGLVFTDRTRLTSPDADLSVEPDALVVLYESIQAGRVRLVPKAGGEAGRWVELEGAADIVVECVSDSSVGKDTRRLVELYRRAGVREYWLVDARGDQVLFALHRREGARFAVATPDADGFSRSAVLDTWFRLTRRERLPGIAVFQLEARAGV